MGQIVSRLVPQQQPVTLATMETQVRDAKCVEANHSKVVEANHLNGVETSLDGYVQRSYAPYFNDKCFSCMASRTPSQILSRCSGCQLVTYCDRVCQKDDWFNHKYVCKEFPVANGRNALFTKGSWGKHMAQLRERGAQLLPLIPNPEFALDFFDNPRVCHNCWKTGSEKIIFCKCTCVSYCSETCANADIIHRGKCERFCNVLCLSNPLSIFNALHEVSARLHQGGDGSSIYDMVSLTIHVVDSTPIFNPRAWEDFMATFPKLNKLNVVFVIQRKDFAGWFLLNSPRVLVNTYSIAYSVQQMHYHHFFASMEYAEPDVVVVFDNMNEMDLYYEDDIDLNPEDDIEYDINSEMSYRNMVYNPKTILILMDKTEKLLSKAAEVVKEVQPVVQLIPLQVNPIKEAVVNEEPDIDSGCDFLKEKQYYICLRRK